MTKSSTVEVGGRQLSLSNLDKPLWPDGAFTKGQMIDYYARVAPAMLPHLSGRALTLRRFPNGVDAPSFFEKNCPSHRPRWVDTVTMGDVNYCTVEEPAALVWVANLAAIELHPTLACRPDLERPTTVVFDLDPGAPADVVDCGRVAVLIREALEWLGLQAWVKTSGSKGLQVYVPLNTKTSYDVTKPWSLAFAQLLESAHRDLVVTTQDKRARRGKVLIDWSQNTASKTTVCAYSLRARPRPTVSTPVSWDEVKKMVDAGDGDRLVFEADEVLRRVERNGDLLAPVLDVTQKLPELKAPAG